MYNNKSIYIIVSKAALINHRFDRIHNLFSGDEKVEMIWKSHH